MFGFLKKKAAKAAEPKPIPPYEPDPDRILLRCSFNEDACGWMVRGAAAETVAKNVKLSLSTDVKRSGNSSLRISGRYESWHGPCLDIAAHVREGLQNYEAMAWVKVPDDSPSCKIYLSLETNSMLAGVVFPYYEHFEDFNAKESMLSKYRLPVGIDHGVYEEWETAYPEGYTTADGWVLLRGRVKINRAEYFRSVVYIETNGQGKNSDIYIDDFILMRG